MEERRQLQGFRPASIQCLFMDFIVSQQWYMLTKKKLMWFSAVLTVFKIRERNKIK